MSRKHYEAQSSVGLPYRYLEQQRAIDRIAAKLGVVAFYPDYHRDKGDKNTVLLYTKEDEMHNREVDRQSRDYVVYTRSEAQDRPYHIDDKYIYHDHFWSFENSDKNGHMDYGFGNYGKLDLRGPDWYAALEESILRAYQAKTQPAEPEEEEPEEQEYHVKVTTVTHLYITAKSGDEAIEKACGEAWEHDADEIDGEIIEEENEE